MRGKRRHGEHTLGSMRHVEPPQNALLHLGVHDADVGHAVDLPGDIDELVELLDELRTSIKCRRTRKNNKCTYLVHNRGELALEGDGHSLVNGGVAQDFHEFVVFVGLRVLQAHGLGMCHNKRVM